MSGAALRRAGARAAALVLGLAALPVLAQPPEPAAEQASADPRLERADELIGSREGYAEAIALYRAVLDEQPGNVEARLSLARVLSWDEKLAAAIAEYDRVLQSQPARSDARIERAEVLSWAGDYGAARAAFAQILREEPRNARAERGRARTALWAGRLPEADRAFARALQLEEDAEARADWEKLRAGFRPRAELLVKSFSDSDDVNRREALLSASSYARLDTRMVARLGWIQVHHPQDDVPLRARSAHDRDRAREFALGVDRSWSERVQSTLEIGGRDWQYGGDAPFARTSLSYAHSDHTSLALFLERADFADASDSFEAVENDVRQSAAAASLYHSFSQRLAGSGRVELGDISDGNTRRRLATGLSFRPSQKHRLSLGVEASESAYSRVSDHYYDPKRDVGLELALEHTLELLAQLELDYRATLGFQSTCDRADGVLLREAGTETSAEAGLHWVRGPWVLELRGALSYSQRSSRYHTNRLSLRVERTF